MKHLFIYLFLVCLTVICKIRNENEGSLSINAKNVNQKILSDYSLNYRSILNQQIPYKLNPLLINIKDRFFNQYLNFLAKYNQNMTLQTLNSKKATKKFKNHYNININHNTPQKTNSYFRKKDLVRLSCDSSDIYCLCKFHPRYKDCVCMAYPKSVICSSTFCKENKEIYECNPLRCDSIITDKKCFCKENINDIHCKCKLNPLNRECFCLKYPFSHLCNERICQLNPNSMFCKCSKLPKDEVCSAKFCVVNPKHPLCECVVDPMGGSCKCLNNPNLCPSNINLK